MLDAKGYDLKVTDKNGNILYEDSSDNIIESGNSINVSVPWTVPSNLENEEVTVTVTERGIENAKPVSATKAIPYDTRLDVSSFESNTMITVIMHLQQLQTTVLNRPTK